MSPPSAVLVFLLLLYCCCTRAQGDDDDEGSSSSSSPPLLTSFDDATAEEIPYHRIHQQRVASIHQRATQFIASSASSLTTIQCRNYKDLYRLLYKMCLLSVVCSERYSLEQSVTPLVTGNTSGMTPQEITYQTGVSRSNFVKFVYRLALPYILMIRDTGDNTSSNSSSSTNANALFLLEDKVPLEWIPRYVIALTHDTTHSCHTTFNLYAQENLPFIYSTHYLMHVYSRYVRNDYECHHINEWLHIDSDGHPHCACRQGKSCDNEGNYQAVIIALTVILILLIIACVVSFFLTTPKLIAKIHATNQLKLKQL